MCLTDSQTPLTNRLCTNLLGRQQYVWIDLFHSKNLVGNSINESYLYEVEKQFQLYKGFVYFHTKIKRYIIMTTSRHIRDPTSLCNNVLFRRLKLSFGFISQRRRRKDGGDGRWESRPTKTSKEVNTQMFLLTNSYPFSREREVIGSVGVHFRSYMIGETERTKRENKEI